MGTDDQFKFVDNAKRILNLSESPDLGKAWMEFPQITDSKQREIVKSFLIDCDTYIKEIIQ